MCKSGLVRRSKLSDYPISSSASESGSAEVAMHYAFAACDDDKLELATTHSLGFRTAAPPTFSQSRDESLLS
jgi:hypothetical protein